MSLLATVRERYRHGEGENENIVSFVSFVSSSGRVSENSEGNFVGFVSSSKRVSEVLHSNENSDVLETEPTKLTKLLQNELRPTWAESQDHAGAEFWDIFSRDQRDAYRHSLYTSRLMRAGVVPSSYTATGFCNRCGPVFLPVELKDPVLGCPWCFVRAEGRLIPRPRRTDL